MSDEKVFLFSIKTKEYDAFEGKALEMLKNFINNCNSVEFNKNANDEIEIAFYKVKQD